MPSDRISTGSPTTSVSKRTSPRTRSLKTTSRCSGMRKRIAAGSPLSTRCFACSGGMSRQRTTFAQRLIPVHLELLGQTEAPVGQAAREQLDDVRAVDMKTLGLPVRTELAALLYPFVPVQPHPPQVFDDGLLRLPSRSLDVRVLDAQDERAARPAREKPVEQRRP